MLTTVAGVISISYLIFGLFWMADKGGKGFIADVKMRLFWPYYIWRDFRNRR